MATGLSRTIVATFVLAGVASASPALAQSIGYGSVFGGGGGDASASGSSAEADHAGERDGRRVRPRSRVTPYIEATQVVTMESSPNDEVLTYTQLAAGVDAALFGINSEGSVSLRYQRSFGWQKNASDADFVSGIARGDLRVAPGVKIEVGGVSARNSVERSGGAVYGPLGKGDTVTQVYSAYAGPTVSGRVGDVALNAGYQIGYSRTEEPNSRVAEPGAEPTDMFSDSLTHLASVHAGVKPHDVLPIGMGVGATYAREDISNLDQRVKDLSVRADVTVPLGTDLALVGGVGYEDVEVSSRDALRGPGGIPVVNSHGNYVTDKSRPRLIAYDTSGLIWDAGVLWRPSRRTAFEAHVGRRYGGTTVYGTFAWAPNARTTLNVAVYDNLAGTGGVLTRALADLPTVFTAIRNPLSGDLAGCVSSVQDEAAPSGPCLNGALSSLRSSVFRGRGVMANYGVELGRIGAGLGAGYDRRKFIGAPGSVLALYNGVVDENFWMTGYLNGRIDQQSSFNANIYANWFQSGSGFDGEGHAIGATAAYNRYLTGHLSATAALALDGVNREAPKDDYWIASALLGVRYSF
jgi:hypothetical protein